MRGMPTNAAEVLEYIDPVDPDRLMPGPRPGLWIAWWSPLGAGSHIAILDGTPCVVLVTGPYEPDGLPGWTAVEFEFDLSQEISDEEWEATDD